MVILMLQGVYQVSTHQISSNSTKSSKILDSKGEKKESRGDIKTSKYPQSTPRRTKRKEHSDLTADLDKIFGPPEYLKYIPYYTAHYLTGKPYITYEYTIKKGGDSGYIEVYITFDEPRIEKTRINGKTYELIYIKGCGLYGEIGSPLIPVYTLQIALPSGSIPLNIMVRPIKEINFGYHRVVPRQKPTPINEKIRMKFVIDEKTNPTLEE